ncbi:MAG: helix-turn-helix domain-containing protein [Betaproteobacteria bacterium]|nr:helix-turn-helix domain-containing protein [Betaproteobacteria bacterium]
MDVEEAAHFLHIHTVTLRNKVRCGEIPGAKLGKRWVFLRVDLERYIRSQYPSRALQGDNHEVMPCHSTSVRTRRTGGSKSVSKVDSLYSEALGL